MSDEARLQSIIGWVGISSTSAGDMVIYLYDENPKLNFAIALVYEEEFEKLPSYIKENLDAVIEDEGVNKYLKSAPTKADAQNEGWLRTIDPPLKVMVKKKRIDWLASGDVASGGPAGHPAQAGGQLPAEYIWEPLTQEQHDRADELIADLTQLQWVMLRHTLSAAAQEELLENPPTELLASMYRAVSYEFAKVWPAVRGAVGKPLLDSVSMGNTLEALLEVEAEDFIQALVDASDFIVDADFAKLMLKAVGETGIKSAPEERVTQARKVFLFVELTTRHGLNKGLAKNLVSEAFDQIPF